MCFEKNQFPVSLYKQFIPLKEPDVRTFFFLQNIKYEAFSFLRIHNVLWQLIWLCSRPENQLIYMTLGPSWGPVGCLGALFLSSVRRRSWGLHPSAGTPPLDLFSSVRIRAQGYPRPTTPFRICWFFPQERWTPWVRIGAWVMWHVMGTFCVKKHW